MDDIIINDWFDWIRVLASSNRFDRCIYFHFPKVVPSKFKSQYGKCEVDIIGLVLYALVHEEIHLVLHNLGEDIYSIDCAIVSVFLQWVLGQRNCPTQLEVSAYTTKDDIK